MFLTTRSVENIIIDLDSFQGREEALNEAIRIAQLEERNCIFASEELDGTSVHSSGLPVVYAKTQAEQLLFANVLRRILIDNKVKASSTVLLSAGPRHLRAAHEVLLGTIVIKFDDASDEQDVRVCQQFPDFFVRLANLERSLDGRFVGFAGEYYSAPDGIYIFGSSRFFVGKKHLLTFEGAQRGVIL